MLFGLLMAAIVVLVALARAYSATDERFLGDWAEAHALELTEQNRPVVAWYLHTARVLRTWGVLGGFFLAPLAGWAVGVEDVWTSWISIFGGYLAGALYAEVALRRPLGGGRRSASLFPRRLRDYLPARLLWAQRILAVVAGGAALFAALDPPEGASSSFGATGPGSSAPILVGVVAVGFGFGLEWVQRWLVQRPQPFTSPSMIAADDAIRSQAVHSLAGSGLAVLLLLGAVIAVRFGELLALFFPLAAVFVCLYYGHRAWRVPGRLLSQP